MKPLEEAVGKVRKALNEIGPGGEGTHVWMAAVTLALEEIVDWQKDITLPEEHWLQKMEIDKE